VGKGLTGGKRTESGACERQGSTVKKVGEVKEETDGDFVTLMVLCAAEEECGGVRAKK
jgi:hypothetical protein